MNSSPKGKGRPYDTKLPATQKEKNIVKRFVVCCSFQQSFKIWSYNKANELNFLCHYSLLTGRLVYKKDDV